MAVDRPRPRRRPGAARPQPWVERRLRPRVMEGVPGDSPAGQIHFLHAERSQPFCITARPGSRPAKHARPALSTMASSRLIRPPHSASTSLPAATGAQAGPQAHVGGQRGAVQLRVAPGNHTASHCAGKPSPASGEKKASSAPARAGCPHWRDTGSRKRRRARWRSCVRRATAECPPPPRRESHRRRQLRRTGALQVIGEAVEPRAEILDLRRLQEAEVALGQRRIGIAHHRAEPAHARRQRLAQHVGVARAADVVGEHAGEGQAGL